MNVGMVEASDSFAAPEGPNEDRALKHKEFGDGSSLQSIGDTEGNKYL